MPASPPDPVRLPARHPARPTQLLLGLAALGLVGTLALGVPLRWFLAGVPLIPGEFKHLRHAHTHLGYYAVLFPLLWWAWPRGAPGPLVLGAYSAAVVVATVGFLREGYGLAAIAGSTGVLGVWLASAVGLRGALRQAGWLGSAGPAVVLGAACIPAVAVLSGRDPVLSGELVRTFLSLVLLGAVLPTALRAGGAPAPPWPFWLACTVLGALYLGPLPHRPLGAALALLGALLGRAAWAAAGLGGIERGLWGLSALGLGAWGLGLAPLDPHGAVAGLHFLVLGPVLLSFERALGAPSPGWARAAYAGLVCAMAGAIWAGWARASAALGTGVAAGCVIGIMAVAWSGRSEGENR